MIQLQELAIDDWRAWRTLRLQALAEAPYAFGSKLADWQGDGDREERWRRRLADVPLNLIARVDGDAAGMASGVHTAAAGVVELISMWVAPSARGRGVSDALVNAVIAWAAANGALRLILNVKTTNQPAIGLYRRSGFVFAEHAARDPSSDPDETTMVRDPRR